MTVNKVTSTFEEFEAQLKTVWHEYHYYIIPDDTSLSPVQLYLLKFLHNRGVCKSSDIAREFGVTLGAVTGLIDRLLKLGLVSRKRSEKDRRMVLIELTGKGKETVESFERWRRRKFMAVAKRMDEVELKQLILLLDKLALILSDLNKNSTGE